MTGPAIPVFQPDVKPAWSFQGPGDVGAVGGELHSLAKAFSEMQAMQHAVEQDQMQHALATQALGLKQQEAMNQAEEIKLRQIQARDAAAQAKAKFQADQEEKAQKRTDQAAVGKGLKEAEIKKNVAGVADANVPMAPPGFDSILAALLGAAGGGQPGTPEMADTAVADFMAAAKDQKLQEQAPRDVNLPDPNALLRSQDEAKQRALQVQLERMREDAALARAKVAADAAGKRKTAGSAGGIAAARAAMSVPQMENYAMVLDGIEKVGFEPGYLEAMKRFANKDNTGSWTKGFMDAVVKKNQIGEGQMQLAVADAYASLYLLTISGTAASESERWNVMQQVSPTSWDTPEVRQFKGVNREIINKTMRRYGAGEGMLSAADVLKESDDIVAQRTQPDPTDSPDLAKAKKNFKKFWAMSRMAAGRKAVEDIKPTTVIVVPNGADPASVQMMQNLELEP